MDEWEVLRMLQDNPNVVDLIDVYETDDEVQMVLEYCKGGELFDYIQRKRAASSPYIPSEAKAAKITKQMLSVLNDLHGRGIVHRDVKPENLLLTCDGGSEVKICDFGIARLLLDECDSESCSSDDEGTSPGRMRAYSRVGSDLYAAPEVCMGDGYGTAVDMYSLGVTIFVLLYGFSPTFDLQEDGEVGVSFPDNEWSQVSEDAKELVRQMLEVDPDQRITAERALESHWIKRHAGSNHFSGANSHMAARRRASHLFALSPTKPRPPVDLELVKARLYKNIESSRKRSKTGIRGTRKKPRMNSKSEKVEERRSMSARDGEALMSMADLYRGVASAATSATNAAKGVVCDERLNVVNILVDDSNDEISDDDVDSMLALSV
jgi:serine/threonine protein kinase